MSVCTGQLLIHKRTCSDSKNKSCLYLRSLAPTGAKSQRPRFLPGSCSALLLGSQHCVQADCGLRAPKPSTGKALVEGDSLCVVLQRDLPLLVPSWELARPHCAPCASRCSPDVVAKVSVWFLVTHSPAVVCLSPGTGRSTCGASQTSGFHHKSSWVQHAQAAGDTMAAAARSEPTPRSVQTGVVWFRSLQHKKSKLD